MSWRKVLVLAVVIVNSDGAVLSDSYGCTSLNGITFTPTPDPLPRR